MRRPRIIIIRRHETRVHKKSGLAAAFSTKNKKLLSDLLGVAHHVVHRRLDLGVGCGRTALGRHEAGLALEALDGVLIEFVVALGDAILPCRLVAELRRARDAHAVAGLAGTLKKLLAGVVRRLRRLDDD